MTFTVSEDSAFVALLKERDQLRIDVDNYRRELLVASVDAENYRRDAEVMAEALLRVHNSKYYIASKEGYIVDTHILTCTCPACTVARKYIERGDA